MTMAVESPMANFNRNNPFVIEARKKYNELMELYHELVRCCIISFGITAGSIIASVASTFRFFIMAKHANLLCVMMWICMALYSASQFWILTRYTIGDPANKEIDKMALMEINDIMNVNLEYIYSMIHNLQGLISRTEMAIKLVRISYFTIPAIVCVGTVFALF